MAKLHQILAIEKGVKSSADKALTQAYHTIQKPELFSGLVRTYQPLDDEGERRPPESKKIQYTASELIKQAKDAVRDLIDITATKDATNTRAKANLVVGGTLLASDVPVTTLLFLEKRLTDVRTFVSKLPTLDPAETWILNPATGQYETTETQSGSTKKVNEPVMLAAATEKHPAQVQLVQKDVLVGYWHQRKLSAAMPVTEQSKLLDRIDLLLRSIKMAREEANSVEAADQKIGDRIMDYVFSA